MTTAAEERAAKERERARRARKFVYEPVGLDAWEKKWAPYVGRKVVKTQPYGCPRNGTMGHCYIADAETGAFIGLVLENSLRRA